MREKDKHHSDIPRWRYWLSGFNLLFVERIILRINFSRILFRRKGLIISWISLFLRIMFGMSISSIRINARKRAILRRIWLTCICFLFPTKAPGACNEKRTMLEVTHQSGGALQIENYPPWGGLHDFVNQEN